MSCIAGLPKLIGQTALTENLILTAVINDIDVLTWTDFNEPIIKPIPLWRAAYLKLFIDILQEFGVPFAAELHKYRLPTTVAVQPDAYIPLQHALSFIQRMANSERIADFGLLAGRRLQLRHFGTGLRRALGQTLTLEAALASFCRLGPSEISPARFWIVSEAACFKICSSLALDPDSKGLQAAEWIRIMASITIVRQFAGQRWYPTQIAFQSRVTPGHAARELFPGTRFLIGQQAGSIAVPSSLLSRRRAVYWQGRRLCESYEAMPPAATPTACDFPDSLRKMLLAYLPDGYPNIELAAEIAGISVRTLQRRLKRCRLSYSDLVQQLRFDAAVQLLQDPAVTALDAAYAVGYEDPSNFSRAFKRMAGIGPRRYRQQL